ncbi:MAG: ATP-binding protein [Oscillospiraceae bacterium]|jgi:DNA replication protein DnaC|nr:ATP-binding protein [Oscillospiraceae bacterium]
MALDGKILHRARERLAESRRGRELRFASRRDELYIKNPRLYELDREISLAFVNVAKALLRGGNLEEIEAENLRLQDERKAVLRKMGLAPDALDEVPNCPICGDRGYTSDGMCVCLNRLYKEEQSKELSKLLKLGTQTFKNFSLNYYSGKELAEMQRNFRMCKRFAEKFSEKPGNILMSGNPGLGKTHLSCAIARVVSDAGFSVVYETAIAFCVVFDKIKFQRLNQDDELLRDAERYASCDLLILDDLGTEMRTANTISAVYDIINTRLVSGLSTIVNTNLAPEEIGAEYSPQIASRLLGEYNVLEFAGSDMRSRIKQIG